MPTSRPERMASAAAATAPLTARGRQQRRLAGCRLAADPPGLFSAASRLRRTKRRQALSWDSARCMASTVRKSSGAAGRISIVVIRGSRSTVDMSRHRFGAGEYRYFAEPFPHPLTGLKEALYPKLLPIARWATALHAIALEAAGASARRTAGASPDGDGPGRSG